MFIDARHAQPDQTFSADVCIVGAGPAALAVALGLAGQSSSMRILLIESGGMEIDPAVQALNRATTTGDPYDELTNIRARAFGGTANLWRTALPGATGAKFTPLDPIDFQHRPWVPHSGWPFDRAHMNPWYDKALRFCGIGPLWASPEEWSEGPARPWPLENTDIRSDLYQLGPDSIFLRDKREQVQSSENIRCLLHATVTEIQTRDSTDGLRAVSALKIQTLTGMRLQAAAPLIVLAAGAIENARLLLVSNVGNDRDQVGRYYMDHPSQVFMQFVPSDRGLFDRSAFYDRRRVRGIEVLGRLGFTPQAMEREQLLNLSIVLAPRPALHRWRPVEAIQRFKVLLSKRQFSPEMLRLLYRAGIGLPWIVGYLRRRRRGQPYMTQHWSTWPSNAGEYQTFEALFHLEQSPDPDNRLTLTSQRDALGMPMAQLHWRWRDLDKRSIARAGELLDASFRKAGLGQWRSLGFCAFAPGNHHPMGTTRMSGDPSTGVTNANARVHGMENLYIAGQGLFPTTGFANPMLTSLALSLRLADHLAHAQGSAIPRGARAD